MRKVLGIISVLALGLLLFLQACASKPPTADLSSFIDRHFEDPDQAAVMQSLADQLDEEMQFMVSDIILYSEKIKSMSMDYDVSSEEIAAVCEEFDQARRQHLKAVYSLFEEMRSNCSEEDWNRLADIHIAMLSQSFEQGHAQQ